MLRIMHGSCSTLMVRPKAYWANCLLKQYWAILLSPIFVAISTTSLYGPVASPASVSVPSVTTGLALGYFVRNLPLTSYDSNEMPSGWNVEWQALHPGFAAANS